MGYRIGRFLGGTMGTYEPERGEPFDRISVEGDGCADTLHQLAKVAPIVKRDVLSVAVQLLRDEYEEANIDLGAVIQEGGRPCTTHVKRLGEALAVLEELHQNEAEGCEP